MQGIAVLTHPIFQEDNCIMAPRCWWWAATAANMPPIWTATPAAMWWASNMGTEYAIPSEALHPPGNDVEFTNQSLRNYHELRLKTCKTLGALNASFWVINAVLGIFSAAQGLLHGAIWHGLVAIPSFWLWISHCCCYCYYYIYIFFIYIYIYVQKMLLV